MIACEQVTKRFGSVTALAPFDLSVDVGQFIAIKGASGSGKTTLLLTLGGMLRPTEGTVLFDGTDLYAKSVPERADYRAQEVGFVFQMFHLVPYLDLLGNVLLACPGKPSVAVRQRAGRLLDELDLAKRANHRPGELSAGERQRLAVARALLNRPKLILADEPTGNLDSENAAEVIRHLAEFHRSGGTVVLVTHGAAAETHADRILRLEQGRLVAD